MSTNSQTEESTIDADEKPKLDLDVKVDSPSACERHVTVTVPRTDIESYYDDAFTELMPTANVPGFRSGRAPRKLVENRFRKEVTDQVKGSLLLDCMTQVTEDQDFSAISEPDFDFGAVEVPDDGPLTFEFDIEVRPEFDLPDWQGLKLEKLTREFTKKDVDRHLSEVVSDHGVLAPVEGEAEEEDRVVVNMTFKHAGNVISEANELAVRVRPVLSFPDGSLDGFGKLLIGCRANDHKAAKLTLSYDAPNEELRGEEIEVDIEVLEVKRMQLPEMSADMLSRLGNFNDEGDLRDSVEQTLQRQLEYRQQKRVREQITSVLTESANWELPPAMLDRQSKRELDRAILEIRSAGFSEPEIKAHENQLRQNSRASTERALKEHFILERIAEEEDLEATDDDYDREIMLIAMQSNDSPRRVRARVEKRGLMDALRNQIVERKVLELIKEKAEFKEVQYKPEDLATEAVDHFVGGAQQEIPEAKHGGDSEALRQPTDHT